MKGLDAETFGGQFMVQALMGVFGIDQGRAIILTQRAVRFAAAELESGALEAAYLIETQKVRGRS